MITLGARLKLLREEHDWTLREVAEKAVISEAHISLAENNKVLPSLQMLQKFGKVYDVSPRDLLFEAEGYDTEIKITPAVREIIEKGYLWEEIRLLILKRCNYIPPDYTHHDYAIGGSKE